MSAISFRVRELRLPELGAAGSARRRRIDLLIDIALAIFVVAMMALMVELPGHEAAPFHFIFFALALTYGYRVWPVGRTIAVIVAITVPTGLLMVRHVDDGLLARAELAEIPLLPLVLLAMVWHAQRRVTALRQVQRLTKRQQAGLEREREFFRDASHAIRAPVTIARGHIELAAMTPLSDGAAANLSVALTQLHRLSALSNRLLTLAGLDSGSAPGRRPIDLAALIRDLGTDWSGGADRRWTVSTAETGLVQADPEWIGLAVDALLENAVHFTADGDEISLTCRIAPRAYTIAVADSGPGIDEEDLPHLFDRFWHRLPPNGPMGSGLGLSIARAAAVAHGGTLTARNAHDGGAVFELEIPRSQPTTGGHPPAPAPLRRLRDVKRSIGS
jgi:signal transduction histidine kinase